MSADVQLRPMDNLKRILNAESIQEQFKNALAENSGAFVASIIDLFGSDTYLQQCEPKAVVMEALKAATLKLPISKQLGFAYIVPYKKNGKQQPQFQIGYKGYVQLAMRSGQYRFLNAGPLQEGITINRNTLTGEITFSGEAKSQKAQGYFAYLQLLNGFSKVIYMTVDEVMAHAKQYSQSWDRTSKTFRDGTAWSKNFDEMATKTVIRQLLSHYGIMSTDMVAALSSPDPDDAQAEAEVEIDSSANGDVIDVETAVVDEGQTSQPDPGF